MVVGFTGPEYLYGGKQLLRAGPEGTTVQVAGGSS